MTTRRDFLSATALAAGAAALPPMSAAEPAPPIFKISLAEWSYHKALFAGKMKNIDFPGVAKKDHGIEAVEWVNQFWKNQAKDQAYLKELKARCDDLGVRSVLIMCDDEGHLGDPDEAKRTETVENHKKWLDAAKFLGCHSIRVNAHTGDTGTPAAQGQRAVDGLHRLCEVAAPLGLNVIVENHGGLSSDGKWLAGVMKEVNLPNCGTLPDFGNFQKNDRYEGVDLMMPFARGVSAKTHDFDPATGEEIHTDYHRMMKLVVKQHNYHGFVGIEYEGEKIDEAAGVRATKALLEKVREELAKA